MSSILHVTWFRLAFSVLVTLAGWFFRLIELPGGGLVVAVGTLLLLAFGALMLRKLTQQAGLEVGWPLGLLATGLALLGLELLGGQLAWAGATLLRSPGEALAALGSLWLLINLNQFLSSPIPPKRLVGQK